MKRDVIICDRVVTTLCIQESSCIEHLYIVFLVQLPLKLLHLQNMLVSSHACMHKYSLTSKSSSEVSRVACQQLSSDPYKSVQDLHAEVLRGGVKQVSGGCQKNILLTSKGV